MTGFIQGLALGFSIAAPVGPIGVLCIRRTLTDGIRAGLLSGLGAATADALYGSVAAFGLTALAGFLIDQAWWMRPVGALVLAVLGARAFFSRPPSSGDNPGPSGWAGAYLSTLSLTLTNPLTVLSFAGAYAGLGLGTRLTGSAEAASLVVGVFLGSSLWWAILAAAVNSLRARLTPSLLVWVNRVSGTILILFAGILLIGP
jgi:threonine/homoserine/homoserine lactone efflux protein